MFPDWAVLANIPPSIMGNQHTMPLLQISPRRICLIKPSALGDIVQTLPVLAMLRQRWPGAHIAWVVNRSLAGILAGHPQLDQVLEFDRGGRGHNRMASLGRLLGRLRAEKFDLTIDLQGLARSGLFTWATRSKRRVGFSLAREGARLAYTDIVPLLWALPSWQRMILMARAVGCTGEIPPAIVPIRPDDTAWAAEQLANLPRPWLAIHPGAQWETKRWLPQHFAALALRAQREMGSGIVLIGGPGERPLCDQIAAELPGPTVNLAERTPLLPLAAVCQAADVLLSGDSGPMHLAAALGTATISVFTCTSPRESGPRQANPPGDGERMLATTVDCAASYRATCPTRHCMQELLPARVWPALRGALVSAVEIGNHA